MPIALAAETPEIGGALQLEVYLQEQKPDIEKLYKLFSLIRQTTKNNAFLVVQIRQNVYWSIAYQLKIPNIENNPSFILEEENKGWIRSQEEQYVT